MNKKYIIIYSFRAKLAKYKHRPHHISTMLSVIKTWYDRGYF